MIDLLEIETYDPHSLLEHVMDSLHVRNDSILSRSLGVTAPTICKVRHKKTQITADLLIRMHDATGESLDELRKIGGIPKTQTVTVHKASREEACSA